MILTRQIMVSSRPLTRISCWIEMLKIVSGVKAENCSDFSEAGLRRALACGVVPEASHTDALLATMPLKSNQQGVLSWACPFMQSCNPPLSVSACSAQNRVVRHEVALLGKVGCRPVFVAAGPVDAGLHGCFSKGQIQRVFCTKFATIRGGIFFVRKQNDCCNNFV